jgi:hypothetical protein
VRTDLPLADQMVQVGHVCLEAGAAFGAPCHCPLVLLAVHDEAALRCVLDTCHAWNVRFCAFTEPDAAEEIGSAPMGLTTACTEPVCGSRRKLFRRFRLWRPPPGREIETP